MKRKNIYLILLSCLLCVSFSILYSFSVMIAVQEAAVAPMMQAKVVGILI